MIRRDVLWERTNIAGLELLGRKLPVVLGLSRHTATSGSTNPPRVAGSGDKRLVNSINLQLIRPTSALPTLALPHSVALGFAGIENQTLAQCARDASEALSVPFLGEVERGSLCKTAVGRPRRDMTGQVWGGY
jgi:hypothetical protein